MACIKSVNRSASVALSPDAPYLAAGTMAGAVDLSFSTSAFLEVFKLDFQSDDQELPLIGQTTSSERFNRLSWGKNGSNSEEFAQGLIAGGLLDGTIGLWNPQIITRSEANENPLVGQLSRHKGPVRGLEFNSIQPHLLASGADDGEICIWDLAKPTEPSHFPPLRGSKSAAQGEISFLSWNSKLAHILASTSYNGTTVVWDLKKQKPVISFSDSSRRRCSVLQWNPDIATQLVVASDDDTSPSLRLWDMRNTMSPIKEFVGHTKGVISMAWCPSDISYLLTCGKDNRTICWDTLSGEIVSELPAGTNWNFDVHWYPKIPGVISASSFDGKIGLYNVEACSRYDVGETDFGAVPLRAPKWYKSPAGVSFGFGGKLVSFHSKHSSPATQAGDSEVYVHSLVTEDSLVSRSSEFETTIQNGERSSLKALCEQKSQECESKDERETWGFLKVMFDDDGMARTKLLTHLGFSLPEDETDTAQDKLSEQNNSLSVEETVMDKPTVRTEDKGSGVFAFDNGEDFFNNLPSPKADTPVSMSVKEFDAGESAPTESHEQVADETPEESPDSDFDDAVQRALVVGDYKGAVAQCMSAGRMADALVIAHVGGLSLWESTRDQYLKLSRTSYLKVVSAMVNHDLMSLVNSRPIKSWKETLALLCTFAQREEWTMLCDTLASKLMTAGNTLAATLCYICAGNIDKTVEIWSRCLTSEVEGKSYVDRLQDLMEKTIVFALATGQKHFSVSLCKLVEKYAEILASQGLLSTALEYLKLMGDDLSPELAVLRDRITFAKESEKSESQAHPGNAGADVSNYHQNGSYYQDAIPSQMQPIGQGTYSENYQQYSRGYPDTSYQQIPQSSMFVPSPAPQAQVPQQTFAQPAAAQPSARPSFVPAPAPMLKNADQFQQPPSLGSQLYPTTNAPYQGAVNTPYQPSSSPYQSGPPGPVSPMMPPTVSAPGPRMPQAVAPTLAPMGFIPVTSPGVAQRPGINSTQPNSPTHAAPATTAAAPPAPTPTVQTADTSKVPAHQKPVIATLTRLFNETSSSMNPVTKKREIDDNSKKLGALFAKLNIGDISKNAADQLVQYCQAMDDGDNAKAHQILVNLTTTDWDECSHWIQVLKRMMKNRTQNVRR